MTRQELKSGKCISVGPYISYTLFIFYMFALVPRGITAYFVLYYLSDLSTDLSFVMLGRTKHLFSRDG